MTCTMLASWTSWFGFTWNFRSRKLKVVQISAIYIYSYTTTLLLMLLAMLHSGDKMRHFIQYLFFLPNFWPRVTTRWSLECPHTFINFLTFYQFSNLFRNFFNLMVKYLFFFSGEYLVVNSLWNTCKTFSLWNTCFVYF